MPLDAPDHILNRRVSERAEADNVVETYVTERLTQRVSPERQAELNRELLAVTRFFAGAKIDAYVAGGSGIDLLDGTWDRDHQDLDMAIMGSDRLALYDAATHAGFQIAKPGGQRLSRDEVADRATHNAFLRSETGGEETRFEVIFLNESSTGDVELTTNAALSKRVYEQGPRVVVEGQEVRLQPPEVTLYYKLTDGRRKDARDIRGLWNSSSPTQREQVVQLIRDAKVCFEIDGQRIANVQTLLEVAERKDQELHKVFFESRVAALEAELGKDIMEKSQQVFGLREKASDRLQFLALMESEYNGVTPQHRSTVEAIADILYQNPDMKLSDFQSWATRRVGPADRVKNRALSEYVSEQLWKTTEDADTE